MPRSCFLIHAFIFYFSLVRAQDPGQIVGITYGSPDQKFTSLDLPTKEDSTLATIGNAAIWQGNSTYDKIHNRFFAKNGLYIYTIDAETGILLDSIPGLNTFYGIEYNETCDCLVGIYTDLTDNSVYYSSIDFNSKSLNNINAVVPHANYFGESTYDRVNNRYFRMDQGSIEVIDNAGLLMDALPRAYGLSCIEYDAIGDRIIGTFFGVSNQLVIASIDLNSHQVNLLDSVQLSSNLLAGESTFDDTNQRYFFRTMNEVYYFDLQYHIFEAFPNALPYIGGIEYKAPPPPVVTTAISENQQLSNIEVYPNPVADNIFFSGLKPGSRIKIFDGLGQLVYDFLSEGEHANVTFNHYKPGVYFYVISFNSIQEKKGKLILK